MAELPDLTIFANSLEHKFKGKVLKTIEILVAKTLNVSAKLLKDCLEGQKLKSVHRVGKTLQFHLGRRMLHYY